MLPKLASSVGPKTIRRSSKQAVPGTLHVKNCMLRACVQAAQGQASSAQLSLTLAARQLEALAAGLEAVGDALSRESMSEELGRRGSGRAGKAGWLADQSRELKAQVGEGRDAWLCLSGHHTICGVVVLNGDVFDQYWSSPYEPSSPWKSLPQTAAISAVLPSVCWLDARRG